MIDLRAYILLGLIGLWTLLLLPVQMVAVRRGGRMAELVPILYHRVGLKLLGLKVVRRGEISRARPTLFVANHISWIDIVVFGALLRASFIAKREVSGWGIFGLLARLQRSVFIERKARKTADHRDEMVVRLEAGDSLILFPEGTSSDGLRILPFKSAFFVLAERPVDGRPLVVQPVSITYRRLNHMPVGRRWMPIFAWVGDEDLPPHFWRFLKAGPAEVVVEFHAPVRIDEFASRKAMCAHCRDVIVRAVSAVQSGRDPLPASPAGAAFLD